MTVADKKADNKAAKVAPARKTDSTAARLGRFAVGSIFGLIFIGLCFVMLTVALKGPDTIQTPGANGPYGLLAQKRGEPLRIGDTAPDFILEQLGGEPVQLSKLRGKTVFVNFWATWCAPCKEEMPAIQRIYQKYKNSDVVVLAVNIKDSNDSAKSYFKDLNLTMPVLLDRTGAVPGDGYRVTGYPESYFVDKNGKIGEFKVGALDFEGMEQKLQTALKAGGGK